MIDIKTEEKAIRVINDYYEKLKTPRSFINSTYLEINMPDVNAQQLIDVLVAHGYITYGRTRDVDFVHIERLPKCVTYFEDKTKMAADKKVERLHDWLIAIFTAFAGALLSKPLWDLISFLF